MLSGNPPYKVTYSYFGNSVPVVLAKEICHGFAYNAIDLKTKHFFFFLPPFLHWSSANNFTTKLWGSVLKDNWRWAWTWEWHNTDQSGSWMQTLCKYMNWLFFYSFTNHVCLIKISSGELQNFGDFFYLLFGKQGFVLSNNKRSWKMKNYGLVQKIRQQLFSSNSVSLLMRNSS